MFGRSYIDAIPSSSSDHYPLSLPRLNSSFQCERRLSLLTTSPKGHFKVQSLVKSLVNEKAIIFNKFITIKVFL